MVAWLVRPRPSTPTSLDPGAQNQSTAHRDPHREALSASRTGWRRYWRNGIADGNGRGLEAPPHHPIRLHAAAREGLHAVAPADALECCTRQREARAETRVGPPPVRCVEEHRRDEEAAELHGHVVVVFAQHLCGRRYDGTFGAGI